MNVGTLSRRPVPAYVRPARVLYLIGILGFLALVAVQIFLAGATLLVGGEYLLTHRAVGEAIGPYLVALLIVGALARLPRRLSLASVLLFVDFVMQYVFVYALKGPPRALHAANALALFSLAAYIALSVWSLRHQEAA